MTLFKCVLSCSVCGHTTVLQGISDKEEVVDLAKEDHMDQHKHFFVGVETVTQYEDNPEVGKKWTGVKRPAPRR